MKKNRDLVLAFGDDFGGFIELAVQGLTPKADKPAQYIIFTVTVFLLWARG